MDGVCGGGRGLCKADDSFSEDSDDEDEKKEGGESIKQTLLSSDDPRFLEETTREALEQALRKTKSKMTERKIQPHPGTIRTLQHPAPASKPHIQTLLLN